MTSERRVDVAIIGTGTAGLAAHSAARRHTDSLLLIEGGAPGTTCARVGCMPSKLLIAAADVKRHIDEAAQFGIRVDGSSIDGAAVMQRVRSLRDRFVGSVLDAVAKIPAEQRLEGMARFESPRALRVGSLAVIAERIVIATGSEPVVPQAFRALGDRVSTSDSIFELPSLPRSIAVVGGGVIGLELGQAFHALGVRTRLFHRSRTLGPRGDPVVSRLATELYSRSLPCVLGVDVVPSASSDGDVELSWRDTAGAESRDRFERVLVCIGRRPRLAALDLARSGLQLDRAGVPVHDRRTMRCGESSIFIAGDVADEKPLLHEAADDGRVAGENAGRYPAVEPVDRKTPLAIAFTEPQYATVGESLDSLDPSRAVVGEVSFADQGRSRVIARNAGIGRLYADREGGRLLGAQLVGPAAEHLSHLLAWAVQRQLTVADVLELPFYHPVIEEGLRTALKDLRKRLSRTTITEPECIDCGPGI